MDGQSAPTPSVIAGESVPILEAAAFLRQCCLDRLPLAVLTGSDAGAISDVLGTFAAQLPGEMHVGRMPAPTDSPQTFLESILTQFGFEPDDLSLDDLQRLLLLMLRQCSGRAGGPVILLEDAQDFGPRVLGLIRDLLRSMPGAGARATIVLAGTPDLRAVLDSPGMASVAHLSCRRFDLDGATCGAEPLPVSSVACPSSVPMLVVMSAGQSPEPFKLGDRPVLIGRGELANLRLESRFISRHHALVVPGPGGFWIIDLKSTNGTLVNSRTIRHCRLRHGDVISVGNHRIRFEHAGVAAQTSPDQLDSADTETRVMRSLRGIRTPDVVSANGPRPLSVA